MNIAKCVRKRPLCSGLFYMLLKDRKIRKNYKKIFVPTRHFFVVILVTNVTNNISAS